MPRLSKSRRNTRPHYQMSERSEKSLANRVHGKTGWVSLNRKYLSHIKTRVARSYGALVCGEGAQYPPLPCIVSEGCSASHYQPKRHRVEANFERPVCTGMGKSSVQVCSSAVVKREFQMSEKTRRNTVATTIHFWDLETMAIIVEELKRIVTWKDCPGLTRRDSQSSRERHARDIWR
jgi:hypothetical protein